MLPLSPLRFSTIGKPILRTFEILNIFRFFDNSSRTRAPTGWQHVGPVGAGADWMAGMGKVAQGEILATGILNLPARLCGSQAEVPWVVAKVPWI